MNGRTASGITAEPRDFRQIADNLEGVTISLLSVYQYDLAVQSLAPPLRYIKLAAIQPGYCFPSPIVAEPPFREPTEFQ